MVAERNHPTDTVVLGFREGLFLQPGAQPTIALPELLPPEGSAPPEECERQREAPEP